jgi:myosin heavy subunit|tara:strand:+ start:599 stop:1513 length:915 start_codon:yes stop_codon:yes gene_type:complete
MLNKEETNQEQENALAHIEKEVKEASGDENFEIEVTEEVEEPKQETKAEEPQQEEEPEYGEKVQKRIKKLVDQRRDAELQTAQANEQVAQLTARLERLEQGNTSRVENEFNQRYAQTKQALAKAVEEGDTQAQLNFTEQLADMRAAMRIAEMQRQQQASQAVSPTVGRAQQVAQQPAPKKAMDWWEKNRWFNAAGFERETAAARAIDVQLDLEGHNKESDEYYELLNNRLQKVFPELKSGSEEPSKPRAKSRQPVSPTAGGSPSYKGNRVRMTQDQLRMARELGINDDKGLKQYAAEIQRQQRS